ncbi:GNAT family N-acetyltransferase [Brevundimonas sp.]|uniref:GNAT family N-acetyltransferase n=1 Tax=Brevundimonas sp. TaxID=1871086 RepID=UPI0025D06554|nr:GNAT family N-acetyltransferase [Brevundimonas sp.]
MTHPLDRPVWSALTSRQAHLAVGGKRARRFAPGYGIFAAVAADSPESWAALKAINPPDGGLMLMEVTDIDLPPDVPVAQHGLGVQMVADAITPGGPEPDFIELGDADAAEMLALATLTQPGPFFESTHRLGGFIGVRIDGRLAAMAGERMKPEGFTEVSGVCTHPDFRGRGLGAALSRVVANRILARGETPFLHAWHDNAAAIGLYERLGFRLRTKVNVAVLGPAEVAV